MTPSPFKPVQVEILRQAQLQQTAYMHELTPAEHVAVGTPNRWEIKDHVAHMTYWLRQRLVLSLQAILQNAPQPEPEDFEQRNPMLFEHQRFRSWSEICAESEQVYTDLLAVVEQLSEEDLTTFNRFEWSPDGDPLYIHIMGNMQHNQGHLVQYAVEHGKHELAAATYERWVKTVLEAGVPETLQGFMLYNLACFYATHRQVEQAWAPLQQSFTLYPLLREVALTDADLVELHLTPSAKG
jgi:DinB superfamily